MTLCALWSLEVWSVPGGWRLVHSGPRLKTARELRSVHYDRSKTRIRKWTRPESDRSLWRKGKLG